MDQDAFLRILDGGFQNFYYVTVFSMLRCFGLTWGFFAFEWALGPSVMLRSAISAAISLPVLAIYIDDIAAFSQTAGPLEIFLAAPKEFLLGFGLGFLASTPFRALQYAGAVTDGFRGESDSGLTDPSSSPLQTFSVLYLVVGFYVFFSIGGLWKLVEKFYATFQVWPIDLNYPPLSPDAVVLVIDWLQRGLELAIVICAPLLILLFSIDFILMIATKLGRKFNLYDLSFLAKNLITLVTLPLTAMLIIRVANTHTPEAI